MSYFWRYIFTLLLVLPTVPSYADSLSDYFAALNITVPKQHISAPNFHLQDINGREINLSDYRGKLVLVNFWATFCAPCRHEMPALESLWLKFKDDGFVVLAVAADRGKETVVSTYIRSGGFTFPVPLDPEGIVRNTYEVKALPMTYLIGRDGKFLGRALGARDWAGADGQALIRLLLRPRRE
ncbi:MAG: TlpA family protein disulfide reductase [Gammaproteobacteria bacterium]|nr:TlpA family protein disulfide reductase [Gammaproteobacteria bacterium]